MAKRKLPIFPLWISDYEADTRGFSFEEHGFYLRLLFAMWERGGSISADNTSIARALGTDPRIVHRLLITVRPKLERCGDSYTSPRLQKEWNYAVSKSDTLRIAGRLGQKIKKENQQIRESQASSHPSSHPSSQAISQASSHPSSQASSTLRKKDNNLSSLQVAARASEQPSGSPHARQSESGFAEDSGKGYLFETEFMKRSEGKS